MLNGFKKWWKVWGQLIGFLSGIIYLNAFFLILGDLMHTYEWLTLVWLVSFFGFVGWYSWQMRIHGWRLPKSIKDTH